MAPTEPKLLGGRLPNVVLTGSTAGAVSREVCDRQAELMELVDTYGGVLITTLALRSPEDFQEAVAGLINISQEYPGGAPRQQVTPGGVFTTTEFHSNLPIPAHTELSYMPRRKPELISFFCARAPRGGGMTPVIDMKEVLRRLPADLVSRFRPGIMTCINLPPRHAVYLNTRRGEFTRCQRCWRTFGETPEAAAANFVQQSKEDVHVEWSGDWMQPFTMMPAVEQHMGADVWTGFWPSFHWAGSAIQTVYDLTMHHFSLRQVWTSSRVLACTALELVGSLLCKVLPTLQPVLARVAQPGGLSCKLKDGGEVHLWDVFSILRVYNDLMVKWTWQPGQFVVLDNHRMGHMRTPYDPAERSVYTVFGSRKKAW